MSEKTHNKKDISGKVYIFDTSRGAGVPGLPHELTEAQASEQGVLELLIAAIANGSYTVKE